MTDARFQFSADEIAHCEAAMLKPAPLQALALIASGRAVVQLSSDGREVLLDLLDGQPLRYRGRKMSISGAWPLFRAGMIDESGAITASGALHLDQQATLAEGGVQ